VEEDAVCPLAAAAGGLTGSATGDDVSEREVANHENGPA
jgi:hypothetical protein